MIPVRLELKNFMSYGEQVAPLEFTGMHLACLSGDNGNGKSALLDAITWVLWGEARASADELIRLGTDEMRVTFDFEMGGNLYRVIRGRSKRNSGNVWEIYVAEGPEHKFIPITGQGIRDTAKVIQRILHMDYKTFVNSAYIQQGKADEFTKQTVADRKKILADILDLSRYDALEQKAKERRNEAERLSQDLTREIDGAELEIAGEEDFKRELEESKTEQESLSKQIVEKDEQLQLLRGRQSELEAAAGRVREMEQQVSDYRTEIENLLTRKSEQEQRVAKGWEILSDKERIVSGREKLRIARESLALFDTRLAELRALEHKKNGLEQSILMEKHKLDLERQSAAKELAELQAKVAGAEALEADAQELRARVADLEKAEARRAEIQKQITEQSDRLGELKAQHDQAKTRKEELEGKMAQISEPGAQCPICLTELVHEKHESVITYYQTHIAEADALISNLRREGIAAKTKREEAQKAAEDLDAELKAGLEIRHRLAQAEQVLFSIGEYRKQMPGLESRLSLVSKRLEAEDFAGESRTQLKEIEMRIAALEYDGDAHKFVKEELAGLEGFEALAVRLKHAEENLPADEAALSAVSELILAREKTIADTRSSIETMSKSLGELPAVNSEIAVVSAALNAMRESDRLLAGRIATSEHNLERCKKLRAEIAGKRKDLEKARRDKGIYDDLVAAFGKKGVQALIIENAIPEIQEEANRLLARMTDNAMQVSIETIRDKKTGGTAETLDIRISDDMGTRSYELFSGGEAFRVNFALRIALSKLLARRAGARLQTLIIDEGFGTQDGKGREKLVEAIDSIKDDFELILVITHIDELKDAFPTRIEVAKDSLGSQISVN